MWGRYIGCENGHLSFIYTAHTFLLARNQFGLHRISGMVAILLSFLSNYDNLTLKLHHQKRSYPDKRWLFIGRFKVGSVPGKSVALVASKKYQNPS